MVSCCLSILPECLGRLINLVSIVVKGNQINNIHSSIMKIQNLTEFFLTANQLSTIVDDMPYNLESFKFDGNKLKYLPENIGHSYKIKKLQSMAN